MDLAQAGHRDPKDEKENEDDDGDVDAVDVDVGNDEDEADDDVNDTSNMNGNNDDDEGDDLDARMQPPSRDEAGAEDSLQTQTPMLPLASDSASHHAADNIVVHDAATTDELESFRQQWRREIRQHADHTTDSNNNSAAGAAGAGAAKSPKPQSSGPSVSEESMMEAFRLFAMGNSFEEEGRLNQAVALYQRAARLVPDIDIRFTEWFRSREKGKRNAPATSAAAAAGVSDAGSASAHAHDDEDHTDDLLAHALTDTDVRIQSADSSKQGFTGLADEIWLEIFSHAICFDFDVRVALRLSLVCKKFYLLLRDSVLWKQIATGLWPSAVTPSPWNSWMAMCRERPRLQFHGLYISRNAYVRYGEQSLDQFYKPVHLVEFFRYMRFFSDGCVAFFTSTDPLTAVVPRVTRSPMALKMGVMLGTYTLFGHNEVLVHIQHTRVNEKRQARRGVVVETTRFNYNVRLRIVQSNHHKSWRLEWVSYTLQNSRSAQPTELDLTTPNDFRPLVFARVRAFMHDADHAAAAAATSNAAPEAGH
eukprot:m.207166 g.207166  ORF g.207166 m.207166 type:complete len:534 (+) comp17785_c0_seq10:194-1795(+)